MAQTDTAEGSRPGQRSFWYEHSLTILIIGMMLAFAIVFWFAGLEYWQADQQAHGKQARIWPDFVVYYIADMADSLFGSMIGALVIVQGTKYLRERGSQPSSQDKGSQ
jgi:predicted negative regulator of RcsB-dependent stress response